MVELPVLATAWSSLEGYSSVLVGLACSLSRHGNLVELGEKPKKKSLEKFRKKKTEKPASSGGAVAKKNILLLPGLWVSQTWMQGWFRYQNLEVGV
jgi:hypothetical protein